MGNLHNSRRNVIADAQYVVIVGGGAGTLAKADLAVALGKRVLPYGASGGTAQAIFQQVRRHPTQSSWIPADALATLDTCARLDPRASTMEIEQMTEDFVDMLDYVIHADRGESRA